MSLQYKSNLERKPALKRWFLSGEGPISFSKPDIEYLLFSKLHALLLKGEHVDNVLRLWGFSPIPELEGSWLQPSLPFNYTFF